MGAAGGHALQHRRHARALAIFIGFRNNSAYGRWWEARTLWGGIVNSTRVLARLIITFTDSHTHQPNYDRARSEAFKREMVHKVIAWAHALRIHLRGERDWRTVTTLMPAEERATADAAVNKPNVVMQLIGQRIYRAMADGTLGGFDSFQMEGQLLALANYQGGCERIKNTPPAAPVPLLHPAVHAGLHRAAAFLLGGRSGAHGYRLGGGAGGARHQLRVRHHRQSGRGERGPLRGPDHRRAPQRSLQHHRTRTCASY